MTLELTVFTDGGARGNPGPAALGVVIYDQQQNILYQHGEYLGEKTNNEAEYQGFLHSLKWIDENVKKGEHNIEKVSWKLDSLLVVEQLNKRWKIKEQRLFSFAQEIWQVLKKQTFSYTISHVPRAENYFADKLVNEALDRQQEKI